MLRANSPPQRWWDRGSRSRHSSLDESTTDVMLAGNWTTIEDGRALLAGATVERGAVARYL